MPPSTGDAARVAARLQPFLSDNQSTAEHFCSHEDALVHLNTGTSKPSFIHQTEYKVAHALHAQVDEWLAKFKARGIIGFAPAGCPWNSPLVVVPKKDALGNKTKVRICLDPRPINAMIDDNYPIPLVSNILASSAFGEYFSTLDL